MPDSICGMKSLRKLYLNNNELTGNTRPLMYSFCLAYIPLLIRFILGAIPADIGDLTSLTDLRLANNKLTGVNSYVWLVIMHLVILI